MPTGNNFISPQMPKMWTAIASAAEITFNTPTNVVVLVDETIDTTGVRITSICAIPRGAVGSACNCQLYKKVGATYTLIDSQLMPTVTPGAAAANPKTDFGYSEDNPLVLGAGTGLAVAIGQSVSNGITFRAHGGVY
ncbi:hypothetical protein [Phenylobacterium soli]|uniref:hypothetical protein n=1 Tax=Phenylobacterium soli TaxID=2170551 RepID=UPI001057F3F7|nr:hypothetical protein [Phenylobacterium soli]